MKRFQREQSVERNTVMPVCQYFSSFLFCSVFLFVFFCFCSFVLFCFLTRNCIYFTSVQCVWFLLSYVSLQSNWAWKPSELGLSISFSLGGFSSLLTSQWRKLRRPACLQTLGFSVATCGLDCTEIFLFVCEKSFNAVPEKVGRSIIW